MISEQYSELCFKGPNIDELGACLIALGAAGAVQEEPDILRCYIDNQNCDRKQLCDFAVAQGLSLISDLPIQEKNWVALSSDVWKEHHVGNLTIEPVADSSVAGALDKRAIKVIPGEGFGTGHHPSTRQALALLQSKEVLGRHPKSVVDVGTGSGILAIAAARIFNTRIDAYDTDERALVNATENIELNRVEDLIRLHAGAMPAGLSAELIVANIYAEVLLQYEANFFTTLEKGGFLIMAGIMEARRDELMRGFSSPRWQLLEELYEGGWCAVLLRAQP